MKATYFKWQGVRSLVPGAVLLAVVLLGSGPVLAQDTIVNCDDENPPAGTFNNLQDAISTLQPDGGTIEVSGICANPVSDIFECVPDEPLEPEGPCTDTKVGERYQTFSVRGFTGRLTIQADPTVGATLGQHIGEVLPVGEPEPIFCDTDLSTLFREIRTVLSISDSVNVHLRGALGPDDEEGVPTVLQTLNIEGGFGVFIRDSDVRFDGGVVVTNSRGSGAFAGGEAGSQLRLNGNENQSGNNCAHGISAGRGSLVNVSGSAVIRDNGRFGLIAVENARVTLRGEAIVEGNLIGGMLARYGAFASVFNQAIIRDNGGDPDPNNFLSRFQSGVAADSASLLLIRGPADPVSGQSTGVGPMILDNLGPAMLVDNNSTAELRNMMAHDNEGGLVLLHQSVAQFLAEVDLSGNDATGDGDLECDLSSLPYGDLGGVDVNNCTPLIIALADEIEDKIEDVQDKVQTALNELSKEPPDAQAALGNIEGAVGELEAAVLDGVLDAGTGTQLANQLAEWARQLAEEALDKAMTGGDPTVIAEANQALLEGDALAKAQSA